MYIFDSIKNFRDISDIEEAAPPGRKIKPRTIFRSEEISRLTLTDWSKIEQLGIRCIIDLRTPNERSIKPYRPNGAGIKNIHIPILCEDKDLNRWQFYWFLMHKGRKLDFAQHMRKFYLRLAFERKQQIKNVFSVLAEEENLPALIHCTGGKDRTGFIVALLQLLSGKPRKNVLESYLATNKLIAARMKKTESFLQFMSLWQISAERIKPMLEVRQEYLDTALDEIYRRYNSIDQYLTDECGLHPDSVIKVRNLLTEIC